jgi:hypothetical protein
LLHAQRQYAALRQAIHETGAVQFGFFVGLFGLASNEFYLVTANEDTIDEIDQVIKGYDLDIQAHDLLEPTARPTVHEPLSSPGIYVFRWFDILNKDVAQMAELSKQAWISFEAEFDCEPIALFAESDRASDRGKMLLITWYRDLSVWEASRNPPNEARENFAKRHTMTIEARPIATRLYLPHE